MLVPLQGATAKCVAVWVKNYGGAAAGQLLRLQKKDDLRVGCVRFAMRTKPKPAHFSTRPFKYRSKANTDQR